LHHFTLYPQTSKTSDKESEISDWLMAEAQLGRAESRAYRRLTEAVVAAVQD
jgi:predicted thioredoxin/glutaredoxin